MHNAAFAERGIDARYETRFFERRSYLHRWLRGPASEALEQTLVDVGAIQALGWLYAGVARTETVRSSAEPR